MRRYARIPARVDGVDLTRTFAFFPPPPQGRLLHVGDRTRNAASRFPTNYISTTRYTVWSFLPVNLFEQFRRTANLYFLGIALLQIVPGLSPISPVTSLAPLIFVLSVSAIKEAFEDYRRHRSDLETNARVAHVCLSGEAEDAADVRWRDVQVGDVVRVLDGEYFPADLICLGTANDEGLCYVETMNLDGETNLKTRRALACTRDDVTTPAAAAAFSRHQLRCELPNKRLYTFSGSLHMDGGDVVPIDAQQMLLRGAKLSHTPWVYGVVVYTGRDSKIMQNLSKAPSKRSKLDVMVNRNVYAIFAFQFLLAVASAVLSVVWEEGTGKRHTYLDEPDFSPPVLAIRRFFTFVILFNTMVPISLVVSIDVIKFAQAYLIDNDAAMFHAETQTFAQAKTSSLNEELGQVKFVLSDKTGTLTQNQMDFRRCSIGGQIYGRALEEDGGGDFPDVFAGGRDGPVLREEKEEEDGEEEEQVKAEAVAVEFPGTFAAPSASPPPPPGSAALSDSLLGHLGAGDAQATRIREFLTALAVCHTVVPEWVEVDGREQLSLQAESPDEAALVLAAQRLGYAFVERDAGGVRLRVAGEKEPVAYELLNVLEFSSKRKRMSAIYRCPDGRVRLYCKGADNVIMERVGEAKDETTMAHLRGFASEGLRTLCVASLEVDEDAYAAWNERFVEASVAISGREEKLEAVAEEIERDLVLLGATAIEDRLQDEVPETIQVLREAGIHVWVLTGDKQETAINIGHSCRLLDDAMNIVVLNEPEDREALRKQCLDAALAWETESEREMAIVIDGDTLHLVFDGQLTAEFLAVARHCRSVICCRAAPLQKAEVTNLVRERLGAITLSIGDGANDVSMIRAAHIGVGISGVEGMQAAMASDYAIAQFRFLRDLLLVHGRWNYQRIAKLILFSFYKNMAFSLTQFWFGFYNGFSGQTLYDSWYLAIYNVTSTSVPIMVTALFDQDVDRAMSMRYPPLYLKGIRNGSFNGPLLFRWLSLAVLHSVVLFFVPVTVIGDDIMHSDGQAHGIWLLGTVCYSCAVVIMAFKVGLETHYWTWLSFFTIAGTIAFWFLFLIIYNDLGAISPDTFAVVWRIVNTLNFWATLALVPVATLLFDVVAKYLRRNYWPLLSHILQERAKGFGDVRLRSGGHQGAIPLE